MVNEKPPESDAAAAEGSNPVGEGVVDSGPLAQLQRDVEGLGVLSAVIERGDLIVTVAGDRSLPFLAGCKDSPSIACNLLVDITVVDWLDSREPRFEVVYQLLSLSRKHRLTVKVPVSEDRPEVSSVVSLWAGANFLEREAWDMFGVVFKGHPDLRRILMYDEFVGHPLRKDYPLQGKQPRVPLRMPEVENSARRMQRGDLVQIKKKPHSSLTVVGQ